MNVMSSPWAVLASIRGFRVVAETASLGLTGFVWTVVDMIPWAPLSINCEAEEDELNGHFL